MSLGVSNTPSVPCSWGVGTNLKSDSAPGRPGQVDFLARQVKFILTCPIGKDSGNEIKNILRLTQGKQHLRAACPKVKLELKSFFESYNINNVPTLRLKGN